MAGVLVTEELLLQKGCCMCCPGRGPDAYAPPKQPIRKGHTVGWANPHTEVMRDEWWPEPGKGA